MEDTNTIITLKLGPGKGLHSQSKEIVCRVYRFMRSFFSKPISSLTDEILTNTLNNISWFDKPRWFKKSFLMIVTRTNRRLQVKPYGLYIIGFNYFATIMNASYSYYNLLSSVK